MAFKQMLSARQLGADCRSARGLPRRIVFSRSGAILGQNLVEAEIIDGRQDIGK
jgi:hypothetical protein